MAFNGVGRQSAREAGEIAHGVAVVPRCRSQGGRRRLRPSFRKQIYEAVRCAGLWLGWSWTALVGFNPGKFFRFFSVSYFSFICFAVFGFLT
jgi:hypothetical protein